MVCWNAGLGDCTRRRRSTSLRMRGYENSARGDSSTGSELKAVEEACREASRTVEPCVLCASAVNPAFPTFRIVHRGDAGSAEAKKTPGTFFRIRASV